MSLERLTENIDVNLRAFGKLMWSSHWTKWKPQGRLSEGEILGPLTAPYSPGKKAQDPHPYHYLWQEHFQEHLPQQHCCQRRWSYHLCMPQQAHWVMKFNEVQIFIHCQGFSSKRWLTQSGPCQRALVLKHTFTSSSKKFLILFLDTLIQSYPWSHLDFCILTESRVGMKIWFLSKLIFHFSGQ